VTDTGKAPSIARAFEALYELVMYLRGESGCPWDRAQSVQTIMKCINEEVGELADALEKNDSCGMSEEWGDSFFTFLMFAAIAEETGRFRVEEALREVETKMIRRHPHVFGSSAVGAVEEVLAQWDRIKAREKQPEAESLMDGIPHFYSALKRAQHVQKLAADVGFDWPNLEGILRKIEEETRELRQAQQEKNDEEFSDEIGDLLFSCVNLARFMRKDSESLLSKTIDKFIDRFKYIEKELKRSGKSPAQATLEEMDALWEKAKQRKGNET
jgi:tetrapyrrole methylase family protein/MazG family protein